MKKIVHRSAERPARAADRIRASASELFYREGIRAVGVDEVVDRAGVTKPSLYRSFASKDDLAAAYMRDYELDFWEKFEKPGGKSYSDAREHVLAYIRWLSARPEQRLSRLWPQQRHRGISVARQSRAAGRRSAQESVSQAPARARRCHGSASPRRARRRPTVAPRRHLRHRPTVGRGAGAVGVRGGEAADRCERGEGVR